MVNILEIENDIVEKLLEIEVIGESGVFYSETSDGLVTEKTGNDIYREANSHGLDADSVEKPVIIVSNSGYTISNEKPVGCKNSQILTSLWSIPVVCKKQDYLTHAAPIMMQIIAKLKGFEGVDNKWAHKMQVVNDVRNFAKPDIDVRVAYYPIFFGVRIII